MVVSHIFDFIIIFLLKKYHFFVTLLCGNWFSAGAGSCSGENFVFDGWSGRVCSGRSLVFDGAGRGALRSPTPPRATGARGLRPSRALPGRLTGVNGVGRGFLGGRRS